MNQSKKTLSMGNLADQTQFMMKECDTDDFIRELIVNKRTTHSYILGTNEGMDGMVQFCSQKKARIIGIDRTFNLSSHYVTVVVYSHTNLTVQKTGNAPAMVGCFLVHPKGDSQLSRSV